MAKTILGERDRKRHTRKVWFVVKSQIEKSGEGQ